MNKFLTIDFFVSKCIPKNFHSDSAQTSPHSAAIAKLCYEFTCYNKSAVFVSIELFSVMIAISISIHPSTR
jgi:hypothetical protein